MIWKLFLIFLKTYTLWCNLFKFILLEKPQIWYLERPYLFLLIFYCAILFDFYFKIIIFI